MELVYVYIKRDGAIPEINVNFSPNFHFEFIGNVLSFEEKENLKQIDDFYGNINSMNLILAMNGTGKSTIFNFLFGETKVRNCRGVKVYYDGNNFLIENTIPFLICDNEIHTDEDVKIFDCTNKTILKENEYNGNRHILYAQINYEFNRIRIPRNNKKNFINKNKILLSNNLESLYEFIKSDLLKEDFMKNIKLYIDYRQIGSRDPAWIANISYNKIDNNNKEQIISLFLLKCIKYFRNLETMVKGKTIPEILNYKFQRKLYEEYINDDEIVSKENIKDLLSVFDQDLSLLQEFLEEEDYLSMMYRLIGARNQKQSLRGGIYSLAIDTLCQNECYSKFIKIISRRIEKSYYNLKLSDLSTGEMKLISILSGIYEQISSILNFKTNGINHVTVLLDEIEENLHPEWSRKLVAYLVDIFKNIQCFNLHIYISSHNPILVSDFFKDRIIRLENKNYSVKRLESKYGILSNISEVLIDQFFLELPYGEHVKNKFDEYYKYIEDGTYVNKTDDIELFIENISDVIVRNKFNEFYNKKCMEDNISSISKEDEIAKLKNKVLELEKVIEGFNNDKN